jgi:membrane protein DedA with SNARE-associated domain
MLVNNWRQVLKRAWSVRLIIVAGFFSGAEVFLPLIDGYVDMPRGIFAAMSGFATAAAFVSRLLAQKDVSNADQ